MVDGTEAGSDSAGLELASVGRTIVFLRSELEALDSESAAAQLYVALIAGLEAGVSPSAL